VTDDESLWFSKAESGECDPDRLETDTCLLRVRIVHEDRASGRLRHGSFLVDDLQWFGVSFIPSESPLSTTPTLTLSIYEIKNRNIYVTGQSAVDQSFIVECGLWTLHLPIA
jgi:hypothetical protein